MPRPPRFDTEMAERDPAAYVAHLAGQGPLVRMRFPVLGTTWITTTAAATEAVLKDADTFAMSAGRGPALLKWWMPPSIRILTRNMLSLDDPDHRRLRKSVDRAFARRGVLEMRADVAGRVDALLDDLAASPEPDLVRDFAKPLPTAVICDLLGLPDRHRPAFIAFSDGIGTFTGWGLPRLIFIALPRLIRLTRTILADIRADGAPGLLTDLIAVQRDLPEAERMTEEELIAMVVLLVLAGMETTTNLIAGGLWALQSRPEAVAWLMADPEARRERVVEELARFVSAVQVTKPRIARRDAVVEGVPVRRGDRIMTMLAAANLDPARFEAPLEFRPGRFPNPHLAFGTGVHFCLGMQLARVEVQEAVTRFLARLPHARLSAPRYGGRPGQRIITGLPVALG